MTRDELFARHVGHRLQLTNPTTLRCLDCFHTLDLRERPSVAGSTSTSSRTPPTQAEACPLHGGWASNCPGCRADSLAQPDDLDAPRRAS